MLNMDIGYIIRDKVKNCRKTEQFNEIVLKIWHQPRNCMGFKIGVFGSVLITSFADSEI